MGKSKFCSKCASIKSADQFFNNQSRSDGLSGFCKQCQNVYLAQHKDKNKQRVQNYVKNNPEIVKATKKRFYETNKEHLKDIELMKHYGISLTEYNQMLKEQNCVCAICKNPESSKRKLSLSVDHDHKTGKIRGLLCGRCNRGLGYFKDNINFLTHAIKYLDKR